jgi:hypothetical protein
MTTDKRGLSALLLQRQLGLRRYEAACIRCVVTERCLEHDWVAKPGTFIYEPAGEAHTLVISDDSPEPALILFTVEGGLIYLDKGSTAPFLLTRTDSPCLS